MNATGDGRTSKGLRREEIMRLRLSPLEPRKRVCLNLLDSLGEVLQHDTSGEVWISPPHRDALMAHRAANIDEDGRGLPGAPGKFHVEIDDAEEARQAVSLPGHPPHEMPQHLGAFVDPREDRVRRVLPLIPREERRVRHVRVLVFAEELRHGVDGRRYGRVTGDFTLGSPAVEDLPSHGR